MKKKRRKKRDILLLCSFCDKTQYEIKKLIAGTDSYICNECIDICHDIITGYFDEKRYQIEIMRLPTPARLNGVLNKHIIRQYNAKKVLSVAVYNHYKRLQDLYLNRYSNNKGAKIGKSNVLLIGPSGSGKTLLAETLADILNVPFTITDATTLTEAGYVGDDVENIIFKLLQKSNYHAKRAQKGIIYIDEIDKICKKGDDLSAMRDVSGEGVQQSLLKLIEGTTTLHPPQGGKKHPQLDMLRVNTTEILFICGGTFVGLEEIILKRLNRGGIGFSANLKSTKRKIDILKNLESEDLIKYGLIPEFVGRLPVVSILKNLDERDLIDILVKPKNALIKQYTKLLNIDGVKVEFEIDSLIAIAKKSQKRKTGARGLRSILETSLLDTMYDLPTLRNSVEKIIINANVIENGSQPIIVYKNDENIEKKK